MLMTSVDPARWIILSTFLSALTAITPTLHAQTPSLAAAWADGGRVQLSWPQSAQGFVLEQSARLGPQANWSLVAATPTLREGRNVVFLATTSSDLYFRLRQNTANPLTTLARISPANGESGISPQREAVVDFSAPLAAATMLTADTFFAEAAGRRLLTRVEPGQDRRSAKLFYLESVPPGTRVSVHVHGDRLRDERDQLVDADGDGRPGGEAVIRYDTASAVGLKGTGVSGYVYASDPAVSGGVFTNRPLTGVVISVDGSEDRLRAVTDERGFFQLSPSPAGRFFVHIDGRTAVGSTWPNGDYYPFVGKTFTGIPGQTNSMPGGSSNIFLPLIKAGSLKAVSATQPTSVTLPAAAVAANPALAGVSLTVPPNSLYADDGTRGGRIGLAPVAPDRLPSPLPPELSFPLVITVQTDGPSNFDQPVPVRFPNLPDPVTGVKLPPGGKSALWSFDHDTGQWEIQGSMTVTADGNFVETDPGVGIRQPGWHSGSPGSTGGGGGGGGGPCDSEQTALENAILGCAIGAALELAELAPAIGCGISLANAAASSISACSDPLNNCYGSMAYNGLFGVAGCIPGVGTFAGALQCSIELGSALGDLAACQSIHAQPSHPSGRSVAQLHARLAANDALNLQERISNASRNLILAIYSDPVWMEAAARDPENMIAFGNALIAALEHASPDAARIAASERTALLALAAPNAVPLAQRTALLDRFDRFASGGMTAAETSAIQEAANGLSAATTAAQTAGWTTMIDGLIQTWDEVTQTASEGLRESGTVEGTDGAEGGADSVVTTTEESPALAAAAGRQAAGADSVSPRYGPIYGRELLYRAIDQATGAIRRGRTARNGQLDQLITAVDRDYLLTFLDPLTLAVGTVFFHSGGAGDRYSLPLATLTHVDGPDADRDGLTDLVEGVVGTSPTDPDTDGDGATDFTEVQQGQNPLDGLALNPGMIASLPLGGSTTGFSNNARAHGLAIDGSRIYVANGLRGLAIVDASDPFQPIWRGDLDLPGESYDVTYSPENAVVGLVGLGDASIPGERGLLHFVDAADPAQPKHMLSYSLPTVALDAWNGLIYVALGQFALKEVRVYDARTAHELGSFATQDFCTGLRVVGGRAYVATLSGLEIFDANLGSFRRLGRLAGNFSAELLGRVHLVLDGTTLYVAKTRGAATVDVSNPATPRFIGTSAAGAGAVRSLALNGGGLMVALVTGTPEGNLQTPASLSVYNATDPANLGNFIFGLGTPGRARDVAMLRGYAAVADDSAGLTILSFAGVDLDRKPPVITFDASSLDHDASAAGLQVPEGTVLELTPQIRDDFQLHQVELRVNGATVALRRNYPVTFRYPVPTLASFEGTGPLELSFHAVDGSGNGVTGPVIPLLRTRDTLAPTLIAGLPVEQGVAFSDYPLALRFNEGIDPASIDPSKIRLQARGPAPAFGPAAASVPPAAFTAEGATLALQFATPIAPGAYQLTLASGSVKDQAGNGIAQDLVLHFEFLNVHPDSAIWISDSPGQFDDPSRWLHRRVPAQDTAAVLQRANAQPLVTIDSSAIVKRLTAALPVTVVNRGSVTVLRELTASVPFTISGGDVTAQGAARFAQALSIRAGHFTAEASLEVPGTLTISAGGSLTMDGTAARLMAGGAVTLENAAIAVRRGAVLELPQITTLDAPGDFSSLFPTGASFRADSPGSRLSLPNLVSANGPTTSNVRGAPSLRFEAIGGGRLELPKLESLTGRTALVANGDGGLVDAPGLKSNRGPTGPFPSVIQAESLGRVNVPALTVVENCKITANSGGVVTQGGQ